MNGTPWGFQEFQMQDALHKRQREQEMAEALQQQQLQTVQNPLQGVAMLLREFLVSRPQAARKDAALSEQLQGFFSADEQRRQQEAQQAEMQRQMLRQEALQDYETKQGVKAKLNPQGGAGPKVLGPGAQMVTVGPDGKAQVLHSNAFKPSNLGFESIQMPDGRTVQVQRDPLTGALFGLDGSQMGPAVRGGIPQTGVPQNAVPAGTADAVIAQMNARIAAGEPQEAVEAWGMAQLQGQGGMGVGRTPEAEAAATTRAQEDAKRASERDANRPKTIETATQMIATIDQALAHPGRTTATGASGKLDPRNYLAGTEATDFRVLNDQMQGKVFLQAFESLKGGGQITQIEGQKAEAAMARLNTAQSDEAYEQALNELRGIATRALERAQGNAGPQMGGQPAQASASDPLGIL